MTKERPNVDQSVYDLAERWMEGFETLVDHDDLVWELAGQIQQQIEGFFEDAEQHGRVRGRS